MKTLIQLYCRVNLIVISILTIYAFSMINVRGLDGIGVLLLYISWIEVVLRKMYYRDLEINKYKVYRLSKEYFARTTLFISMIATLLMIILGEYKGEICIIVATLNSTTSYIYIFEIYMQSSRDSI